MLLNLNLSFSAAKYTFLVTFRVLKPFCSSSQVRACVLYVDPSTRVVALSLRSYLVQPGTRVEPFPVDRIGEVVKDCKMTVNHYMSGAMLKLPDDTTAFIHVSLNGAFNI